MISVALLISLLSCALLLPTASDLLSVLKVLLGRTPKRTAPPDELPRFLVLVPAHDEEMTVAACVRSLFQMHYPSDRFTVAVIADNCDDRTADVALATGACCLEREDPLHPGKPHAIAWALERLPLDRYDAVTIVDADTVVAPGFAAALARAAPLNGKAVQGYFGVENRTENALTRLAAILAAANHRFAYPLKKRAGLNTPLLGNGLSIGTMVLRTHGWRAFSIAEDWEMYAQLTERGILIECVPDAVVYAEEAHSLRESLSQRERWTAGKLTVLVRSILPVLRSRQIGPHQKLDAIAELSSVGPVLHLTLVLLGTSVAVLLRVPPAITLLLVGSLLRPVAYTLFALGGEPDPVRAMAAFAFLPVYAIWRIGAAVSSLRMLGNKPWIRTPRRSHATLDR